jgi:hypothetical protein
MASVGLTSVAMPYPALAGSIVHKMRFDQRQAASAR